MILTPLKELLCSTELKNFDGERVWNLLKSAHCCWIENVGELNGYHVLGANETLTAPQLLVMSDETALAITGIVDVDKAGLATLLEAQLSYVPRYAIMEWYLTPNGGGFREAVICLGHVGFDETFSQTKVTIASMTGRPVPAQVVETFQQNPDLSKAWCFTTLAALRKRGLLLEKIKTGTVWSTQLMPTGAYGIQ